MSHLLTISDAVATHARVNPHRLGARDSKRELNYAQWDSRASSLASGLLELGLKKGDRVGVLAYNCIEWMEIYVALARAGLVTVPLNFRLRGAEISYILEHCEASALIAGEEFTELVDSIRNDVSLEGSNYISLGSSAPEGWAPYESLAGSVSDRKAQFGKVAPEDTFALLYTSGTTGKPKGAIRNHEGNSLIAMATAVEMEFTADDTGLLVMPMCHANSIYFALTFIYLGAPCIIDDSPSFDPESLLKKLSEEKVTFTSLVPTHYIMLLSLPVEVKSRYNMDSVGKLMISSAPARKDTKLAIMDYFRNGKLYELYGSTEAGWVTLLRPEEQITKLGSVGREWAFSGPIKLLDANGEEVADGQVGELFSRTAYAFAGYWRNNEKTLEAFNGEWCSVGDMARRDEDGYIWLVDRKSNMIISGGENVYPSEVEGVVGGHPSIKDVAVIGVADEKWGEAVQAVAVLHQGETITEKELRDWVKERIAGYKCPRSIVFIDDKDMPRTATGKILHRVLREQVVKSS
ncbi:long-chain-fatty-acid--CoA ligase [Streptosporangium jomthongense]|uniref:Class I adenylate-forming enzyme family protein n=1 Tax=Marinobacter aromaticivorans TaxID=1494078 RepID=A0ABW2J0Q9_9GAMM|nr:AMP-binding protein [Marinobacter aromaticivorans]GGE81088.1 long-chain-fatty-acid--CoA ligase [Streptosporangium jomthongense]